MFVSHVVLFKTKNKQRLKNKPYIVCIVDCPIYGACRWYTATYRLGIYVKIVKSVGL